MKTARTIDSVRTLARLVGRSHSSAAAWTKRPDWPFKRSAPWPHTSAFLARVRAYMTTLARDNADAATQPLRREKLIVETRKLNAQADTAEQQHAKLCASLLDANEVREKWREIVGNVAGAFAKIPADIATAAVAAGMPEGARDDLQQHARGMIDRIIGSMGVNVDVDGEDEGGERGTR